MAWMLQEPGSIRNTGRSNTVCVRSLGMHRANNCPLAEDADRATHAHSIRSKNTPTSGELIKWHESAPLRCIYRSHNRDAQIWRQVWVCRMWHASFDWSINVCSKVLAAMKSAVYLYMIVLDKLVRPLTAWKQKTQRLERRWVIHKAAISGLNGRRQVAVGTAQLAVTRLDSECEHQSKKNSNSKT